MKKSIVTLIVMFIGGAVAHAQIEAGTWLLGGSMSLEGSSDKTKYDGTTTINSRTTSFTLTPQAGYFIVDPLAVGLGLDLNTSITRDENDEDDKDTFSSAALAPFVRYYLPQKFFFQGSFSFGSATNKDENNGSSTTTKYSTSGWSISAGYPFFLNNTIAIEGQLGYGSNGYKVKDSDTKYIDQGLFLRFGFQVYLHQ